MHHFQITVFVQLSTTSFPHMAMNVQTTVFREYLISRPYNLDLDIGNILTNISMRVQHQRTTVINSCDTRRNMFYDLVLRVSRLGV